MHKHTFDLNFIIDELGNYQIIYAAQMDSKFMRERSLILIHHNFSVFLICLQREHGLTDADEPQVEYKCEEF